MSFQAYIDTIKAKTGLDPADFRKLAISRGLIDEAGLVRGVTTTDVVNWLAADFDLGRGHAMALITTFKPTAGAQFPIEDMLGKHFGGAKEHWRATFDGLLSTLSEHGPVSVAATQSYVSLLKGKAKFAIVAATADRLDVGIKLRSEAPTNRFEASGSWNSMVTHRVRVTDAAQLDAELLDWLRRAYDAA
ncbi:DUF4287 domain-containing protein [Glaciihabitans arcticus]|uniref:DUF4287 domain-containing protein n=1 Tax=Glaciihabitans arcticus TaxID=2668039 RepID=A0A4Q9GPI2_9MICO|nr:DUF5655 domain-containing protein [Glaciihabitans arcticus]TBN56641.1 DUF4287 domain-containing protein [Glaciihabitans arcticus]